MKQNGKVVALLVTAMILLALAPLTAQVSNTLRATAGNIETDVDNFMSVNDYNEVDMEKWFGYVGPDWGGVLSLGYARKIGGIYLGTYYNGNVLDMNWNGSTEIIEVETNPTVVNGIVISEKVTTTTETREPAIDTNNSVGVLIGAFGMGFRLSFEEDMETASGRLNEWGNGATDIISIDSATGIKTVDKYTDGSMVEGTMIPSLSWGMNLPLAGMTLKPTATLKVAFDQDSITSTRTQDTKINGTRPLDFPLVVTTAGTSANTITPSILLGAELLMGEKDATRKSFGLNYTLGLDLYSNTYKNASGSDEKVKGTVLTFKNTTSTTKSDNNTTVVTSNVANISERSAMNHYLSPSFRYSKDVSDRVSLSLYTGVDVMYETSSTTSKKIETTITNGKSVSPDLADSYVATIHTTTPGNTVEITELNVFPGFTGGLTYSVIPKVFTLNAGLSVNAPSFRTSTTKTTRSDFYKRTTKMIDGEGTVVQDDIVITGSGVDLEDPRTESKSVTNHWSELDASISGGFTLNIHENIALDALMTGTGVTINATQFSLILTIKK